MRRYIVRRLLQSVLILFTLSIIVFLLLRVAPGANPAQIKCGLSCTPSSLKAWEHILGIDNPYLPISFRKSAAFIQFNKTSQYGSWIRSLTNGSLGTDWNTLPVGPELKRRIPTTVELLIMTTFFTVLIGIPFGITSAVMRNSPSDYAVRFSAVLGLAVPGFWLLVMGQIVPQKYLGYTPPLTSTVNFFHAPWDNLRQFLLPAFLLAAAEAAGIMRLTRSSMLEVMRQDYIRTARSKGLREPAVITGHALKNSLIPVVTVLGLQVAGLFGGAVIAETIFNLNGIGQYFLAALLEHDYQVVQTLTLYVGLVVVLANLSVDVMYAWLDPRIRYS